MIALSRPASRSARAARPIRWLAALAAIGALTAFAVFAGLKVQAKGVCCADDAFIAHVAKSLALGEGYVSTLRDHTPLYAPRPFDPMISTGPTLALPAAVLVAVFGNAGWVPGAALVLVTLALLVALGLVLGTAIDRVRINLAVPLFLALCIAFTALHLEHWFALLGEVPAALLVVLACMVPPRGDPERARADGAGSCSVSRSSARRLRLCTSSRSSSSRSCV